MSKPKFHLGQQVVVNTPNDKLMGTIASGQIVGGAWKYGVQFGGMFEDGGTTYFTESEIELAFDGTNWQANATNRIA